MWRSRRASRPPLARGVESRQASFLMSRSRTAVLALFVLTAAGCALYNEVSIAPLNLNPLLIDHGADVPGMVRKSDYLRAIEFTPTVEGRAHPSATELAALGSAELSAGRYDDARKHLRAALQLHPFHSTAAQIEWSLSQAEYMCNNCLFGNSDYYFCFDANSKILVGHEKIRTQMRKKAPDNLLEKRGGKVPIRFDDKYIWIPGPNGKEHKLTQDYTRNLFTFNAVCQRATQK